MLKGRKQDLKKSLLRKSMIVGTIIVLVGASVISAISRNVSIDSRPLCQGNTLYVGGSGSGNYTRIQDAIDNASAGDTVFVYDNSSPYYEEVVINKSINLIGENDTTTIIDANEFFNCIIITAHRVNISRFTLLDSGAWFRYHTGIYLSESNFSNISDINIFNLGAGIFLTKSNYNNIINNRFLNNIDGLHSDDSNDNSITKNEFINNGKGIYLDRSNYNDIRDNNISINIQGMYLAYSNENSILNNVFTDCGLDNFL